MESRKTDHKHFSFSSGWSRRSMGHKLFVSQAISVNSTECYIKGKAKSHNKQFKIISPNLLQSVNSQVFLLMEIKIFLFASFPSWCSWFKLITPIQGDSKVSWYFLCMLQHAGTVWAIETAIYAFLYYIFTSFCFKSAFYIRGCCSQI